MKIFGLLFILIFAHAAACAQNPVYYFSTSIDTAIESNSIVIAGYVKTLYTPLVADSIDIQLRSGSPRPTHMNTNSSYVIHFASGQDSVAFTIQILKDTFPEYPEHVLYVLANPVNGSSIGTDSTLLFVLIDSTPPATINFIVDSTWCYEGNDSVVSGVYIPYGNICGVGIEVNNPNPFYIRYLANSIGAGTPGYPFLNAVQYSDYYFNLETCYAPPGISTFYKGAYLTNENSTSDKYFLCRIQNVDANIITDSLVFFTIRHVNFFDTPSLSFDTHSITVVTDSFASVGIPITISNPNHKPLYFTIDTVSNYSPYPGINYIFNNQEYGYGNGISHDTFWVNFINPHLTGDTISMVFALRNDSVNASPDTLISITVIDTGSLVVSFLGAGFSYLKSDSIGYVRVYTSSFAKYPISAYVSYLNGNSIRDTDFIFHDTTVVFPAYEYDTIALPVIMLQDHLHSGNTQVNLQLSNVNPSNTVYGITQYTFTIIDDEDSTLPPLGTVQAPGDQHVLIYPNPTDGKVNISCSLASYHVSVTNSLGETVFEQTNQKASLGLDLSGQAPGLYLVRISDGENTYTKKILKL